MIAILRCQAKNRFYESTQRLIQPRRVLCVVATVLPAAGYVQEKWRETLASVDFSGEIDQSKPFSIPLVVKNPSAIFTAHIPNVECWVSAEYNDGGTHSLRVYANQRRASGLGILPTGATNYFCAMPDAFKYSATESGAVIPLKQAEMSVILHYETWVPWTIKREVVTKFVLLNTSSGFRWVRGDWIGGYPTIPKPADLEKYPPTFQYPAPAPAAP